MPLAEEMLVWAGLDARGNRRLPTDAQIKTTCLTCKAKQTLAEADVSAGDETIYTCKNGCQPILVISKPNKRPWPGRGYRIGDWTLRNPADLSFRLIDQWGKPTGKPILFPASPAALAQESEAPE